MHEHGREGLPAAYICSPDSVHNNPGDIVDWPLASRGDIGLY